MRSIRSRFLLAIPTALVAVSLASCASDGDAATGRAEGPTREVEHARGVTAVAQSPTRVVTLEPVELDTVVALGITPVGTAVFDEASGVAPYLGQEAADIPSVGLVPEPDLEAIVNAEPDLILGTESRHADLYDQLSAIAPTVFMETQTDPWQENVLLVGRALGLGLEAQALLDEYDETCDELARTYDTDGLTAQLIRPRDESTLSLYGPRSFAGSTLECVGFTTPEQDFGDDISIDVSPELADEGSADVVLVSSPDPSDADTLPQAIARDRAAFPDPQLVDEALWISGVGPKGGQSVLADLDRILASLT